jgi:phospholipase/carboxylesterase
MSDIPLEYVHREPEAESESAVFVLHGRGADEQDLLPVAEQLPGDHHVISFRAPDHLQGGYTWYQLDLSGGGLENSQPHPAEFRRSLDIVAESVDAAVATFNLDPDRLGLLGFSQGAITSFSSVLEAPDRFAWVVGLHGYLAEDHADAEPEGIEGKPIFVGAGTSDQIIPAARSEDAAERLQDIGADVRFETFNTGHGIGQGELEAVVEFVEEHA